MQFGNMPDAARGFIFIWLICIFILGLYNLFHSVQVKRTKHIVISVVLLVVEYFLLQIISDILHRHAEKENVELSYTLGGIPVIWWIALIAGIMMISITLASFFKHWKEEHITPMSVKDSIDMLHAGLCYWEDGGRIILSNKKMDEICLSISGEMLLNIFTIKNYLMPKQGVLSMHCSANEGHDGDVSLFFGLSGTGKTTLSTEANRKLIGDDEHCWTNRGVFNIEGGCYAKCINLSKENEPEIYNAIKFGTVLENVVADPETREVDYTDKSLTENTRAAYPLDFIPNTKIPAVGGHPKNIILLTCDAFGVLPPVSKLTPEQAMYHYISGYTAKVAGTEVGIKEPQPDFSACYGAAFLVWHPTKYAELLADRMKTYGSNAWLVNTGWAGGGYGVGKRMSIKHTRAIIDAIHSGELANAPMEQDPIFGLYVPTQCTGVPADVLIPRESWIDKAAYEETAKKLAEAFKANFAKYAEAAAPEILAGGPF